MVPAGQAITTPDPPAVRAPGNAAPQIFANMDGHQFLQWLTVPAVDMTGTLQHGVRTLTTRTSSLEMVFLAHADELVRLCEQLHRQHQYNLKMKHMLHNQAFAIDAFQHKWQFAGQKQNFVQRTKF